MRNSILKARLKNSLQNRGEEVLINRKIVMKQIGAKVAYFRTLNGMTQEELAKKMNTTKSTISKIERGNYNENLGMSHLMDIADALNIEFTLLIDFSLYEKKMWNFQWE